MYRDKDHYGGNSFRNQVKFKYNIQIILKKNTEKLQIIDLCLDALKTYIKFHDKCVSLFDKISDIKAIDIFSVHTKHNINELATRLT